MKRRRRDRGFLACVGKRQYLTFSRAAGEAKLMRRYRDEIVQPYRCRRCGNWHVGHSAE